MNPPPETSIVVRAYNEARHLPALLDAIDRQRYRDFEVVLVDSGSVDGSREIVAARGHRVVRIHSHDFTFGYSLNVGIQAARGRFMAIASAHTQPCDEHWLEHLVTSLREDDVAMVYGRQVGVRSSKFSECEDFRRTYGPARQERTHDDFFANNANSAVRKDLWQQYRFDETLPGLEDIDWAKHWTAAGYRVVYEPKAALHHIHQETWHQVRHRYYREAVAARAIGVMTRRHALLEPVREAGLALRDLGRLATAPAENPAAARLTPAQAVGEIALFRLSKAIGTMRGVLEGADMSNAEQRKELFFDAGNRAVRITGPNQAALVELPIPQTRPGEILVHVHTVAICATDLEIFEGRLAYYKDGTASYPITPGHEFSGEIAAVGTKASDFREGDRVVVECIQSCGVCERCRRGNEIGCSERTELGVFGRDGGYAEYVAVPARFAHKLPADVGLDRAALVEPAAVVMKGLRRLTAARPNAADSMRCAVVGAGPLGQMCALIMQRKGFAVRVFDRAPERLAFLRGVGIEGSTDLSGLRDFELAIELTGNAAALERTLRETPAGATILLLGLPYGEKPFNFEAIVTYDKMVVGSVGSSKEDFQAAIAMLPHLDLSALTQVRMPLARFREAWTRSREPSTLKVMLDPRGATA